MPADNEPIELNENEFLLFIQKAESTYFALPLSTIFAHAVGHPLKLAQHLEKLCDEGLIEITPNQADALEIIKERAQQVSHLDGPKWKAADERLSRTASQRGVNLSVGSLYIDSGQAVISFNNAMHHRITQEEKHKVYPCSLRVTEAGHQFLDDLEAQGNGPNLDSITPAGL